MSGRKQVAIALGISLAGAVATFGLGLLLLGLEDALHLILPLAVAMVFTLGATLVAARWFTRASLRLRFVAIAAFASIIGLSNLVIVAASMMVMADDAAIVVSLLVYATAAAMSAGLIAARSSADAVNQLSEAAQRLAHGDLDARAGSIGGGEEVSALGRAFDEMAEKLAESRRRVESVEAQRRDLIVAVSHDLRTPLSDLRVMAEAIEDGVVEDPETVTFYTDRILASVKSLSTLVDDLFEFAKLDAGEIERETERAELSEIVGQALAACQAHASDKGLVVRTELGDAAEWDCSPRVTRVVQNLLQNAIRHTPADGTVLVVARTSDAGIELRVEDTGEGVQAEPLERVFEPFWRGDSARTSDGSGLGLAVAKRIVEALGGSISVESQVSLGTRFSVVLPPAP